MSTVYTKVSATIATDIALTRPRFQEADIEETDATNYPNGCYGDEFTLTASASQVIPYAVLTKYVALVLLITGSVLVKINGQAGFQVSSFGTAGQPGFIFGKLVLTGTSITSLTITENTGAAPAVVEIGAAG